MSTTWAYKKIESYLIGLLGLFLLVRYTRALELFGVEVRSYVSGISASIAQPIIIIFFFLVVAYSIGPLIHWLSHKYLTSSLIKWFTLACLLLMFGVSVYGAYNYVLYTDEQRDEEVFNLLNEHGASVYLNDVGHFDLTSKEKSYLRMARLQHPPFHYVSKMLITDHTSDIYHYRFVDLLILLGWTILLLWFFYKFPLSISFLWYLSIIFSFSFLRNYNFIRSGNELFVFITVTSLVIVLYYTYKKSISLWLSWFLALTCCLLAVFSKFSSFVTLGALILSLFITSITSREKRVYYLFGLVTISFVLSLVLYALFFYDTVMFNLQWGNYGNLVSKFIPWLDIEAQMAVDHAAQSSSSVLEFFYSFPFWYGPIIGIGVIATLLTILRKQYPLDPKTQTILLWVIFGVIGVLAINPRAQYTVSMAIGFAYILYRVVESYLTEPQILRLSLITILFGVTETLLIATVENPVTIQ